MKIDDHIISIPPYISTTWQNVISVRMDDKSLIISLADANAVKIPELDDESIKKIFEAHLKYSEHRKNRPAHINSQDITENETPPPNIGDLSNLFDGGNIIQLPLMGDMEGMSAAMQHNSSQSHMPDLPPELLQKISGIISVLGDEITENFPKPEPHCNCMHCQIARQVHCLAEEIEETIEEDILSEEVAEEDLIFKEWDIKETGESIFRVSHPLDQNEEYNVCLKPTLGCTCGQKNCEHIKAVLQS